MQHWGCNYKYGKQTKTERGTSIQWKGDHALSYNDAKTATHKHLKLSTMPRTILFYENYKKINSKTLVKKISG